MAGGILAYQTWEVPLLFFKGRGVHLISFAKQLWENGSERMFMSQVLGKFLGQAAKAGSLAPHRTLRFDLPWVLQVWQLALPLHKPCGTCPIPHICTHSEVTKN